MCIFYRIPIFLETLDLRGFPEKYFIGTVVSQLSAFLIIATLCFPLPQQDKINYNAVCTKILCKCTCCICECLEFGLGANQLV